MRQRSPRIALAVSLFMVVGTISLTLLWPSGGATLNSGMQQDLASAAADGYGSPQLCRQCHPTEFRAWSHTSHANAVFDPNFQVYLQETEKPGECFACHATGYNIVTGQFVLAGVTCEACHGPYRADHPQESMAVAGSAELCGNCHAVTLYEWRASRHGQVGVTCVACHEVHTQRTRAEARTNALCAGCHREAVVDATHTIHDQVHIPCIDCHLDRPVNGGGGAGINGGPATGHSFTVRISTCRDCHLWDY